MMEGAIRLFKNPPSGLCADASRDNADAVVTPTGGGGEKAQAPSAQFIDKHLSGSGFRVHN